MRSAYPDPAPVAQPSEAPDAVASDPLRRTAIYFLAGAIGGLCNIALTVLLVRMLGGGGYKAVGLALSASGFVAALGFEWLRIYALRFGAERARVGSVYALYWMSAVTLMTIAGAVALFGGRAGQHVGALLVATIAVVQAAGDFLLVVARGVGNARMVLLIQAGRGAFALVACGIAAYLTHDPQTTLVTYVCAQAVVSGLTVLFFGGVLPPASPFSANAALQVFRFGGPLMASALINSLLLMSDRWLISFSDGHYADEAVGGYIAVSDIAIRALAFFAGVLVGAFSQDIAAAFDRGEHGRAVRHYNLMVTAFFAVVAPIVVGALVLRAEISAVLFASHTHFSPLLASAVVGAVAVHIARNALIETLMLLEKRTLLVLGINVATLAGALTLSVPLMGAFGMAGAPLGFAIASLAATFISLAVLRSSTRALLFSAAPVHLSLAALAAGLAVALVVPHEAPHWLRLGAFAVFYAIGSAPIALGALRSNGAALASAGGK